MAGVIIKGIGSTILSKGGVIASKLGSVFGTATGLAAKHPYMAAGAAAVADEAFLDGSVRKKAFGLAADTAKGTADDVLKAGSDAFLGNSGPVLGAIASAITIACGHKTLGILGLFLSGALALYNNHPPFKEAFDNVAGNASPNANPKPAVTTAPAPSPS